jgi:hypothetical protein
MGDLPEATEDLEETEAINQLQRMRNYCETIWAVSTTPMLYMRRAYGNPLPKFICCCYGVAPPATKSPDKSTCGCHMEHDSL